MKRKSIETKPSKVHGVGGFATRKLVKGDKFVLDRNIPDFQGFNWSRKPNIKLELYKHLDLRIVVLRDIKVGDELTVPYYGNEID